MQHILVLIDFEDPTELVVEKTIHLAKALGASCWLLHVAAPDPEFVGYDAGPQYIRDHRAEELKREHQILQQFEDNFKAVGISCQALLIQGQPSQIIREQIEKRQIDLVIMGHHRRMKLKEWIFGSVGKEVLRESPVPLLIIPIESKS